MSNRPSIPAAAPDPDDDRQKDSGDSSTSRQMELGDDDSAVALRKAWERTLRGLTGQFNGPTIDNWLRPLRPLSWDGSVVVLGAPSRFAREWVEKKYTQVLRTALSAHLDTPNVQVRFVTFTPDVQPLMGEKPLPLQQAASPKADIVPARTENGGAASELSRNPFALELAAVPLNDRYTFAHFVEGKSNRLAFAGAQAVARAPGTVYNPLFIYGNPGLGKCVAASEYLHLADGRRVRAGDLIGTQFFLLTRIGDEIRPAEAFAEFNAVETVYAIETESGRRIVRNAEHPLWVGRGIPRFGKNYASIAVAGWTPLRDIRPQDLVAVPECLPAFGNPQVLPEYEIKLLAYLIGDGGFAQPGVRFSQQSNAQLAEFMECIACTNCRPIQHSKYDWRIVGARGRVVRGAESRNDVLNLLRRHGLAGKHARDKRIPDAIFQLSSEQLCLFLSRLFATDGWASYSPRPPGSARPPRVEIGFCSASEGLVRDVQELLLKLGILGRITRKPKVNAWTLALHKAAELLKFCDKVGIFGKEAAVERVRQVAEKVLQCRPNRDAWRHHSAPSGLRWERVKRVEITGVEATVAVEVPGHETFLSLFWEHNTHMMHAIGHAVREHLPQARIAYVSGEAFTNHYVQAVRDRRTEDFRRAYRSVDVWLVDDIQTIASKEQTKEEFFHTFNVLHGMNKQIVITSDRSPRDLRTMDERLRSRFESGLIADIAPPELEMREAILQKKARLENLLIPDEVIAFMADLIQSNIRALEGALIKLMAYASLARSPVTKQLARDVLSSYFVERLPPSSALQSAHPEDHALSLSAPRSATAPTVDQIVDAVAAQLGVARALILAGGSRAGRSGKLQGDAGYARQVAMYLAKDISGLPVTTLAAEFGCKNRTAVTHAHNRVQEDMATDANVEAAVTSIRRVIAYNMEE